MRASVVGSRLEVASSRSRTCGRSRSARARATRWRWPPDEAHAALADHRLHAVRQLGHERRDLGQVEGHLQLLVRGRPVDVDVAAQGVGEEEGLLEDERPDAASPPSPRPSRARTGPPARPGAWTCRTRSGRRWPPSSPGRCRGRRRAGRRGRARRRSGPCGRTTPRPREGPRSAIGAGRLRWIPSSRVTWTRSQPARECGRSPSTKPMMRSGQTSSVNR